jgi:hypothetical protein
LYKADPSLSDGFASTCSGQGERRWKEDAKERLSRQRRCCPDDEAEFQRRLYAPLRLNVYENAHGGTTFEYDKPSTQFGQFHNVNIDKVAQSLDDHLLRLIEKVSA